MERLKPKIIYNFKILLNKILEVIAFMISLLFPPKRSILPPIDNKILLTPATELSKKIKEGKLSCEQVVNAFINRIESVNPIINAVVDKRFDKALEEARELDERLRQARDGTGDKSLLEKPLIGVPLTVKESIMLEGAPYAVGLLARRNKRAPKSNKAVKQLIEAGLIPIGSTNTPCMNAWYDSANLVYGRTLNPYDGSRIAGGSSGGEGAILGAAGSVVGLGTDLAGSIRLPCNFCGIFGHKSTPFSVSGEDSYPQLRPHQMKLRGVGPMTRYAGDLLPMLKVILNEGEESKMRLDEPVDIKSVKIFYCEDLGDPLVSKCNSDILAGLRAAVAYFNSVHQIPAELVKLEELKYGFLLWSAEMSVPGGNINDLEHEDGLARVNPIVELAKKAINSSDYPFYSIVVAAIEKFSLKHGAPPQKYLSKKAEILREKFYNLVGDDGVLLIPTLPHPAPHHQTTVFKFLNCAYTAAMNTLQAPITQCPLGMSKEGLPYGIQVIAKPYNDRLTLAIARELERAFGGWLPPSRVSA